jgi:anti-sigma B factor antagonist
MITDPLDVQITEPKPGQRVFTLKGAVTLNNLFSFQSRLRELPPEDSIIDLRQVSYMDSAGIGCLVSAHNICNKAGKSLLVVGPNERVSAVLKHTRVDAAISIVPEMPA